MKQSLFRSIRRKLLGEGRFLRYLTYAVGEIVLIIVGILFALKINDWNEERKARGVETQILTEIRSNLEHDQAEIEDDIHSLEDIIKACDGLIQFLDTQDSPSVEFHKMAGLLLVNPHFDPNHSGYDLLMSKGVEIVQSDQLRSALSELYESRYTYYYRYEEERTEFKTQLILPHVIRYFSLEYVPDDRYKAEHKISQDDYSRLRGDAAFLKLLHAIKFRNSLVLDRAQGTANNIVELIAQLNYELGISEVEVE